MGLRRGVGKKLSNMTSRRVIVLTLVMLFCAPDLVYKSGPFSTHGPPQNADVASGSDFFNAESWGQEFKSSGAMGADLVYELIACISTRQHHFSSVFSVFSLSCNRRCPTG